MKFKRALYRVALIASVFLVLVAPAASVSAILDYDILKFFADNNIIYYDPTLRQKCSSALDCNIAGNTRDEKLWSGLRNLGFTPEQTAAIMGNIYHEGGTPARQESAYNIARNQNCLTSNGTPYSIWDDITNGQRHAACMQNIYSKYTAGSSVAGIGLGFIQWTSHDRRLGYLQLMQDAGLIKYFEGDAYKTYGSIADDDKLRERIVEETGSEADYWALWCTALKYIYYELSTPHSGMDYTGFFKLTTVEDLAGYIASRYEVCSSCGVGQDSYNARVSSAKEIYARYQNGEFSSVEGGTAITYNYGSGTLTDGSKVTIIGDSITVGSKDKILQLLPQADIIAQTSKQFSGTNSSNPTGQEIVNSMRANNTLRSTVVIALGTNSSNLTTGQIDAMVSAIGENRNIIFVNNYDSSDPSKYTHNNNQFDAAATKYDNVSVANWQGAVISAMSANPGTSYIKDEESYSVHPTTAGQELFARTINDAVASDTSSLNTCQSDIITDPEQAISYLQQFIIDTNAKYRTNYAIPPANAAINTPLGTPGTHAQSNCWGAADCGQCTAMSGWFVTMMTNYEYGKGDGGQVVGNLQRTNGGQTLSAVLGQWPTGVAIFSASSDSSHGHTGVILGRDEEGNFITIENNMGNSSGQLAIKTRSPSYFTSNSGTFYPIDIVKVEHLGTTY